MTLFEEFLSENEGICEGDNCYKVFGAYSHWLRRHYQGNPSEPYRARLQKEADRLTEVYTGAIKGLMGA